MNKCRVNKTLIYFLAFLLTLHLTPLTYINSSFLEMFVGRANVGFVFFSSSVLGIIAFLSINKVLKKHGNFSTAVFVICLEIITLVLMATSNNPLVVVPAYVMGAVLRSMIYFNFDIFLESVSEDKDTGGIRGIYLTFINMAFIIGPFIASFILSDGEFWKVYTMSIVIEIPVLLILLKYLKNFEDPIYEKPKFWKAFKKLLNNEDLSATFSSTFILNFFYAWMIVYTPLFLTTQIGFSISETTAIIGIALFPFVILQTLLGKISDKYFGEKEILSVGFIIMAIATSVMTFVTSTNLIVWAAILFTTRIGASMVEIMTETHLFKRINASTLDTLGLYRSIKPSAYAIAMLVASLFLFIIDFKYLFLILGVILLYGLRYSLSIKDTK